MRIGLGKLVSNLMLDTGDTGAGGTAVLTEGAEYKPVAMSMRESQFLETLRFGVEEICRLYKVPPHKVGHMEGAGLLK